GVRHQLFDDAGIQSGRGVELSGNAVSRASADNPGQWHPQELYRYWADVRAGRSPYCVLKYGVPSPQTLCGDPHDRDVWRLDAPQGDHHVPGAKIRDGRCRRTIRGPLEECNRGKKKGRTGLWEPRQIMIPYGCMCLAPRCSEVVLCGALAEALG